MFIPFFITDHTTPIEAGVDFAIEAHPELVESNYSALRYAYRFLWQYRGSKDTFASYRKEIEKFFQWAYIHRSNNLIHKMRSDDIESFLSFSMSPPEDWMSSHAVKRMIGDKANPKWKPFNQPRTKNKKSAQKTLTLLFAAISSFYDYLCTEGGCEYNPVRSVRQKSKFFTNFAREPVRRLSNKQVSYIYRAAQEKIEIDPARGERELWLITLMLNCYLRISEVSISDYHEPTMSDFFQTEGGDWWLRVIGKGRKERLVSVGDDTIEALERYRTSLGMTRLPTRNDKAPIVGRLDGDGEGGGVVVPLSSRQVRSIIDEIYKEASMLMLADGLENEANGLKEATAHWLRHTGISEDVKHRPKEHVKEDAGHASLATTELYINIELEERAKSRRLASST